MTIIVLKNEKKKPILFFIIKCYHMTNKAKKIRDATFVKIWIHTYLTMVYD